MSNHEIVRSWVHEDDHLRLCRCSFTMIAKSDRSADAMAQWHLDDVRYRQMGKTELIAQLHDRDAELRAAVDDMKNHEPASVTTDSGVSAHTAEGNHPQVPTGFPQPMPIQLRSIEHVRAGMKVVSQNNNWEWALWHVVSSEPTLNGTQWWLSLVIDLPGGEPTNLIRLVGSKLLVLSD